MEQQLHLYNIFVDHQLAQYRGEYHQWDGELPLPARNILHQHAIQARRGNIIIMSKESLEDISFSQAWNVFVSFVSSLS